jgi:putative ABC transport system permease protein
VLAAVGIYGLVAYTVTQRTREFGIRLALGANAWDVLQVVMKPALILIGAGIMTGLLGAAALTRLLASQLFGIGATDPVTFAAVSLLMLVIAAAACFIPTRRAAHVDPTVALRQQ